MYENDLDEYIINSYNPSKLVGSLGMMLRENNYITLYDTSVFSSPEPYLKNHSIENLKRDFLYKWFLFFVGLERNMSSGNSLLMISDVVEEMTNLINAVLSIINKRETQYKAASTNHRNNFQNIFEQLLKNREILLKIRETLQSYLESPPIIQPVYDLLLKLIKLLDTQFELKKTSSRKMNDTDEKLAARVFYELIVNSCNVAIYTRDDDIRKLISTTFKLLKSKLVSEEKYSFVTKLDHLNMVVLKYNYEKQVFTRFFESSTLPHIGEFRFPKKLTRNKMSNLTEEVQEILEEISGYLQQNPQPPEEQQHDAQIHLEDGHTILEEMFEIICRIEIKEGLPNHRLKTALLKKISDIAILFGHQELYSEVMILKKQNEKFCLENMVNQLKQEKERLQKQFAELSEEKEQEKKDWDKIQETVIAIRDNLSQLKFFQYALQANLHGVEESSYEKFDALLKAFEENGFVLDETPKLVPQDKISEITGLSTSEIIHIIEMYSIEYQNTQAYLSQNHLLLFLFSKKGEK